MQRGRYSPALRQAEITGKGQPDVHSFLQRKANTVDHVRLSRSYPGGDQDQNFFIKTGELLIGAKNNRDPYERCFSSYNGLYYGDLSSEALARKYVFKGVATGDCEVGGENMFGTDPLDHGFGFLRAGSNTIVNNSEVDLYADDLIAWQFGELYDRNRNATGLRQPDNGLNPLANQNKEGTPLGKALIQVKRFDPMDFSYQIAGAFELFERTRANGGIADVPIQQVLRPDWQNELSTLQEEAIALKFGLNNIIALVLDSTGGALNDAQTQQLYRRILGRSLLNYAPYAGDQLQGKTMDILYGGIFGAAFAKMSRIIGKVMRSSKAGNSVDVMFSHFKCWI